CLRTRRGDPRGRGRLAARCARPERRGPAPHGRSLRLARAHTVRDERARCGRDAGSGRGGPAGMSGEPTAARAGGTATGGPAPAAGGTGERTSAGFWDAYWEGLALPTRLDPSFAFDRCFARGLDLAFADVTGKVLEIGCAPGKWLAYLGERRGLGPAGIEYSPEGVRATRRNFE